MSPGPASARPAPGACPRVPWAPRALSILAHGGAWTLFLVAFLLPVGAMFVRSFQRHEVATRDGTIHVAAGSVHVGADGAQFEILSGDEGEKIAWRVPAERLAEVRTRWTFDHYRTVLGDERTLGLLRNSAVIAVGGALLALLLGLPVAWILARTDLRGRFLLGALCLGPAVLPPFFVALGGARDLQAVLIGLFGVQGGSLQILNSIVVLGFVLFPLQVLLVGPALAAVPAGRYEAARLLRGRGAAVRHVVLPAVLPPVLGAFVLAFVLGLTDFAVPDVLGFMLPAGAPPRHVFATEILLQWNSYGNAARAVATGIPFLLLTAGLLALALVLLRRSPALAAERGARRRPLRRLGLPGHLAGYAVVLAVLGAALVLPMAGIASWAGEGAEASAGGTEAPQADGGGSVALFDFSTTLDRTPGSREERDRWLGTAALAALLALLVALPLARAAQRGGRLVRGLVVVAGALPLAVPGLALGAGTLLLWQALPWPWVSEVEDTILRSGLTLAARFLPFALLATWLALRAVPRGREEAAAVLGAGAWTRARRIVLPAVWSGLLAGGLLVLVLALRELDAVELIDNRILPTRLYSKIHFNRMADEANLLFLCQAWLLGPAVAAALLLAWRRRRGPARGSRPGARGPTR